MTESSDLLSLLSQDIQKHRSSSGFNMTYPKALKQRAAILVDGGLAGSVVAKEVGVSQSTMSKWAREFLPKKNPPPLRLKVIQDSEKGTLNSDPQAVVQKPPVRPPDILLPNGIRLVFSDFSAETLSILMGAK